MRVHYKDAGYSPSFVNDKCQIIDEMLYNMENSLIMYNEVLFTVDDLNDDAFFELYSRRKMYLTK